MTADPTKRLEAALARLGDDHEPPEGWEARVLEATRKTEQQRRWWQVFGPFLVLAVAAVVIVSVWPFDRKAQVASLMVEIHKGGAVKRGSSAQVGDVVHATARGAGVLVLWIYRRDELVLACPGVPSCRAGEGEVSADLALTSIGPYTIVALTSDAAIPAPRGTYDTDVAAAKRAGASDVVQPLPVR